MIPKVFSGVLIIFFWLNSVNPRQSSSLDLADNNKDYNIKKLNDDNLALDIPDPLFLPIMQHTISMANVSFSDARIYGLGKFKTLNFDMRIPALKVDIKLTVDNLKIVGNYTLSMWLASSDGPFTVNLTNVCMKAVADLELSGTKLRARDVRTDIKVGDLSMDLKKTGFMSEVIQGTLNRMGSFLLSSVKPFIILEANIRIKEEINERLLNTIG